MERRPIQRRPIQRPKLRNSVYQAPILEILSRSRAPVPSRVVIAAIGEQFRDRFSDADRARHASGVEMWVHEVHVAKNELRINRLVESVSHGLWAKVRPPSVPRRPHPLQPLTTAQIVRLFGITTITVNNWRKGSSEREPLQFVRKPSGNSSRVYFSQEPLYHWLETYRPDLLEVWLEAANRWKTLGATRPAGLPPCLYSGPRPLAAAPHQVPLSQTASAAAPAPQNPVVRRPIS